MIYRNRVKKVIEVKAKFLRPNPWNWRIHPDKQKEVLKGILGEVGVANALPVRELDDGTYMLIDGHLRLSAFKPNQTVWVAVLDVTEEEAKKLLAAMDPICSMAEKDTKALAELLKEMEVDSKPLSDLFSELLGSGKKPAVDLELEVNGDGKEKVVASATEPEASHVRMVQLYLNKDTVVEFENFIHVLSEAYGTETVTDTVMVALRKITKIVMKKVSK